MNNAFYLVGSLVVLLSGSSAFAQEQPTQPPQQAQSPTISTDRPSFSAGSSTVPTGSLQLEAGVGFEYTSSIVDGDAYDGSSGGFGLGSAPNLLGRFGLMDIAEVRLGVPNLQVPITSDGGEASFGAVSVGAKVGGEVIDALSLGVLGSVSVAVDGGQLSGSAFATADYAATDWLSFTANAGATTYEGADTDYAASALAAFGLSEKVGAYVEWYVTSGMFEASHYADVGATYLLASDLQFDAYVGLNVAGEQPAFSDGYYFGGFGVSKLF